LYLSYTTDIYACCSDELEYTIQVRCHSQPHWPLASYREGPVLVPGQSMRQLWWKK